jgi:hypothetical protein
MSHRRKKRKLKQKYFLKQKAQINADSVEKKPHHLPDHTSKHGNGWIIH